MNSSLPQFFARSSQFLQTTLFKVGDEAISLLWLLKLTLAFLTVVGFSMLFKRLLNDRLLLRLGMSQGHREAIATLLSYGAGTLGFILVLQVNGLNLAPLVVTLGGLGIGVGFGLQEITKNLISGLTLLIEGKLQVGDYVEFDSLSGYIKEISLRSTVIRTFDGGDVVVPNSNLTSNRVLNWSYKSLTGKLHLSINVAYDSDPILVTETLLDSAYMEAAVLHDPPPKVIFKGFGDSALEFELWVWVAQIDEGISVRSSLNFILEHNLRQVGLKMPFPQRDLWLRNADILKLNPPQPQEPEASTAAPNATSQPSLPPHSDLPRRSRQSISIRDALRQFPHFNLCSDLHLRELIETGYRKFFAASDVVFTENDLGSHFYLVLSGSVETVVTRLNQSVKVYHPGDVFGEVAIMLNLPYTATAHVLEDTSLFVIHKHSFERLLRLHPALAETFTQEMTKEKELYQGIRQQLQDLGLLGMTEHKHRFTDWVQERLKGIFAAGAPIA
ncbi:mechanosensitive ion channel [Phormidium sp. CLA17]|uniref:mechanosensitive ion channel domain-containing protein n=1 Tax=Leptolyngbya sp. Cla-17 TaxID=2803751 RepID=UPI001491EB36|nr:mechanosensitive ion channel domain-containing protein [Leptolyngbya sp. Cla-17]MBM0744492.1 mechanosensitive ion channel [Leptolyngbya sp. Cla-17]